MHGYARFAGLSASEPVEVRHDVAALDEPGCWVVVATFEGELTAVRFADVERGPSTSEKAVRIRETCTYLGFEQPSRISYDGWSSSLDEAGYRAAVAEVRERISRGEVYQANICRVMSRAVPPDFSVQELAAALQDGNPAPYAALIDVPDAGIEVACASPELYLARHGSRIESRPIKGTAPTIAQLLEKDRTENVMITDLVRNDLSRVSVPGTVSVDALCAPEEHPGLAHLVSTVSATLRHGCGWQDIWAATFPPGSVSGAPKSTALQAISDLEPAPRGPYCGAIGYVDNLTGRARLAVGIRTFWVDRSGGAPTLKFGTGAGITWGSDPLGEWRETELKAARLTSLADRAIAAAMDGRGKPSRV